MHQHLKITGYMFHGTAIKGNWSEPVKIRSLDEFKAQFGTYSPEGSMTYEYVGGLLSAGLPVLFQRIACVGQSSVDWANGVPVIGSDVDRARCATHTISHTVSGEGGTETTIDDCILNEKYGGTWGNTLSVNIKQVNNTIYITVKQNNALTLERVELITLTGTESVYDRNLKVIEAINSITMETLNINAPVEIDPSTGTYKEEAVLAFQIPLTGTVTEGGVTTDVYVPLTSGTDFDETKVRAEIPSLIYPALIDKILYQPKFITSGGYTDELPDTSIGDAMKNLSLARQDCRALIDLPLGIPKGEQKADATKYAYSQLAGNSAIPSASMCAPWCYMQIGSTQMWVPPSFAFLTLVGSDVSNGKEAYTPKAGLASGRVSNIIKPEFEIGSDIADDWQKDGSTNINPIMKLQSGNYVIAGNSTLLTIGEDEVNAFSESSADLTVIEIRRFVYNTGMDLQYQYNSVTAFENFSLKVSKFLDRMASKGAISGYTIANVSTEDDPRTLKIRLDVAVVPTIKAIEIYLNVAYGNVTLTAGGVE